MQALSQIGGPAKCRAAVSSVPFDSRAVNRIPKDPAHRRAANRAIRAENGSVAELATGSTATPGCNEP